MDTKILIDVVCVHCGSTIHMKKKKTQTNCKITCPGCQHPLNILFDVNADPQIYSFLSQPIPKAEKAGESAQDSQNETPRPEMPKHKTIYKKHHERARYYEDEIPGEDHVKQYSNKSHSRPKLRESLYITRKKMFGLVSERYKLRVGETIIGREDDELRSDIGLTGDSSISRRSISINIVADEYGFDYVLKVLNASNPVLLNGKQIFKGEKEFLELGDVITIGHTNLKFDNQ